MYKIKVFLHIGEVTSDHNIKLIKNRKKIILTSPPPDPRSLEIGKYIVQLMKYYQEIIK